MVFFIVVVVSYALTADPRSKFSKSFNFFKFKLYTVSNIFVALNIFNLNKILMAKTYFHH